MILPCDYIPTTLSLRKGFFSIAKGVQAYYQRNTKDFDSHIRKFPLRHLSRVLNARYEAIVLPRRKFKASDSRLDAETNRKKQLKGCWAC